MDELRISDTTIISILEELIENAIVIQKIDQLNFNETIYELKKYCNSNVIEE